MHSLTTNLDQPYPLPQLLNMPARSSSDSRSKVRQAKWDGCGNFARKCVACGND